MPYKQPPVDKQFKKGQSGNPKGKPLGAVSLVTSIKKFLLTEASDGEVYEGKLSRAIVLRAISKSDVLAKELLDRTDGKVATEITGKDGKDLFSGLSKEDQAKLDLLLNS